MPFFGTDEDCIQITWDSDQVIYAHKVDDFVPVFREQIKFGGDGLHRALAAGESAPAAPAEAPAPAIPADDPPLPPPPDAPPEEPPPPVPGEGSGADDEGEEDAPSKAQRLITDAQSLQHRLTHIPKNPYCDVCNRSRMLKKRTARVRHTKGEDELDPVEEFGQRIAADFIVVHKDSRSTETVVLVVRDEATGYMRTFPLVSRHEDGVVRLLLSFLGKYPSGPCVLLKSDNAGELLSSRYANAGMKLQLGIFAGWRFDSRPSSFREVYQILDYGKLKNREPGYEKAISVPKEEIDVPRGNPVLPMFTAAESALSGFTQAEYEAIDFLDVPFSVVAPSTPVARRHEYITLDRPIRLGATPGCKACKFDATVHTPACKARFDGLIKAEKIAASKSVRDAAPPDVERPDPSAESAPAGDAEAPERASSSAGPSAPAGVVVQSSENKVLADEFGLSASFSQTRERGTTLEGSTDFQGRMY
eukprot:s6477_g2.t1